MQLSEMKGPAPFCFWKDQPFCSYCPQSHCSSRKTSHAKTRDTEVSHQGPQLYIWHFFSECSNNCKDAMLLTILRILQRTWTEIRYTSLPKPRSGLCCLSVYVWVMFPLGGKQSLSKWHFGSQVPGEVGKLGKITGKYRVK